MYKNQPVICLQCKGEETKYGYEAWNTHVEKDHNSEVRIFLVNSRGRFSNTQSKQEGQGYSGLQLRDTS
jgi:hypothetical protein